MGQVFPDRYKPIGTESVGILSHFMNWYESWSKLNDVVDAA